VRTEAPELRAIERLGRVLFLLSKHGDGLTIAELARQCEVSEEVICRDLAKLEEWLVPLYRPDGEDDDAIASASARPLQHMWSPAARWALTPGGEVPLVPPLRFTPEEARAFLEACEGTRDPVVKAALERVRHAFFPIGSEAGEDGGQAPGERTDVGRYRLVKGLRSFYPTPEIERFTRAFEDAAKTCRHVRVVYHPRRTSIGRAVANVTGTGTEAGTRTFAPARPSVTVVVEPLCVVFENYKGNWYLVGRYLAERSESLGACVDRQVVTLASERVSALETLQTTFKRLTFRMTEYFSPAWGVRADDEPVSVKVRFYDEFNVIEKVENRMASRPEARLEKETESTYLYTDVIAGLDEFRRWLRSFGSSAEVLEPLELRNAMRQTAEAMLSLYDGRGRPWDHVEDS
jgi:predicted DNA-binding transcriptional regulator YafY